MYFERFERAFFHAFLTASSGWEGSLLIDRFYCLRAALFCAASDYGLKSCTFDQAAALTSFIKVSLNALGAYSTKDCTWTAERG